MKTCTFIINIIGPLIITAFLFFFIGCSKKTTTQDIDDDGVVVPLSFSTEILDFVDTDINPLSSAVTSKMKLAIEEKYGDFAGSSEGADFDVAMFVNNNQAPSESQEKLATSSNKLKNKVSAKMASAPMAQSIKYRVYLKNQTTGKWQTKELTSGSTTGLDTIQVNKNYSYDWVAVSFNSIISGDVPNLLNAARTGFTSTVSVNNKDFLYAKGVIPSSQLTQNRRLGIVFEHKTARVQVRLDFRGVFMNTQYTAATGSTANTHYVPASISILNSANNGSLLRSGFFNLETGDYTTHSTITGTTPTAPLLGHPLSDRKDFYFYSTQSVAANRVTVETGPLHFSKLPTSDANRYSFTSKTLTVSGTGIGTNNITANLGGNAKINFFFIEAAFRSGNNSTTRWAKANLMYRPEASTDPEYNRYIIRSQSAPGFVAGNSFLGEPAFVPSGTAAGSYLSSAVVGVDMWRYNTLTPNGTTAGDPCGKIIPEGAWRMPTSAEFVEFAGTISALLNRADHFYSDVAAIGFYAGSNPETPYKSKFLTFERSGRITSTSGGAVVDFPSSPRLGFYWSSTPINDLYAILGSGITGTFAPYTGAIGTTHASIRCVRTVLYNNIAPSS